MADKGHLDSLFDQARAEHEAGRLDQAEAGYKAVLDAAPDHHPTLHAYGVLAFQSGRAEIARDLLMNAVAGNRQNQEYLLHLGTVQRSTGDVDDSAASLRRALKRAPQFSEAHFQLGLTLIDSHQPEDAIRHLRRASQLAPGVPDILNALAVALSAAKNFEEAEQVLRDLMAAAPAFLEAEINLYRLMNSQKRHGDAEELLRRAHEQRPNDGDVVRRLSQTFVALNKFDEAIDICDRWLAENPEGWPVRLSRANAILDSGDCEAAITAFTDLLNSGPDQDRYHYSLGLAYKIRGDFGAAISQFNNALEIRPDFTDARYSRGISRLALGEAEAGLEDHESRWHRAQPDSPFRLFPQPLWRGEDLTGKRLLIWAEQGVGDHLMYANLVPFVEELGAECTYECDERLIGMLRRASPQTTFLPYSLEPAKPLLDRSYDFQVPMGSLMTHLSVLPQRESLSPRYIEPGPEMIKAARTRLEDGNGDKRIGISWRSARERIGIQKSIALTDWSPILQGRDIQFVNLQYGDTDDEIAAAASATGASIYTDLEIDRYSELEKLAALIDGLDLVITTSNVTAHLAGALGKETWVLLQMSPLWYWGHRDHDPLFYPTVRPFRQSVAGHWPEVIAAVAMQLDKKLSSNL